MQRTYLPGKVFCKFVQLLTEALFVQEKCVALIRYEICHIPTCLNRDINQLNCILYKISKKVDNRGMNEKDSISAFFGMLLP